MSIASEITRITDNVADAYTAASAKGATMPVTQNSDNLASTISTISSGGVDTKAWIPRNIDANGKVLMPTTVIDLGGATDLADYVFYRANYSNSRLVANGVNFSSLTTISGQYACHEAFKSCAAITGKVDLSSLTTISGQYACSEMFFGCWNITSADLGSLQSVRSYGCNRMFGNCSHLTSVDISNLEMVIDAYGCAYMFSSCSALTSIDVSSLTSIYGSSGCMEMFASTGLQTVTFTKLGFITSSGLSRAFANCQSLTSLYFPKLVTLSGTYCMTGMLSGVTGCTVHFLKAKEQQFSSLDYVIAGFGGTNTTVLFDLGVITATINAPLGSKIYIGSTEIIDPTQTTYSFSVGDGETVSITCFSSTGQYYTEQVTFTQASPSYTVDFSALTYNQIDLSSNVSGVLYKFVNQTNNLNLVIETQLNTIYVPNGVGLYVFGSVAGYTCDNAVLATSGTTSSVALSFTATTADLVFDCFNFAETLTPSITNAEISNTYILDYANNVLQVGVQHLSNKSLSKYVSINVPANATKITINYSAYAQGENNYDYGYILFGDDTATPSTSEVKNQTGLPTGTEYIFTQTSPTSTMQTYTFEKAVTGGTTKLLTFGFAQDSNTWAGDNSTHVGRVLVSFE